MSSKSSRPKAAGSARAPALDLASQDVMRLWTQIEKGIPFRLLERFQEQAALSWTDVADIVQIKPRTLTRRKREGRLQPDESDRLVRAVRIFGLAVELFEGDVSAARQWLGRPAQALGGHTPFGFARSDVGAREVENLIGRLEHGVMT